MAAHQAPPSLGFSRQDHWSGLPFPSPVHESEKWKWKVKVKSLSLVRLLATPWTAAYQPPLSMGFSRQEYWSGGAIAFSIIFLIMLFRPEFKALAWSPKFVLCAVSQCSPKYPVFWQKQSTCSSLNILSSLLSLCFYFLPRLFPHPHIFLSNT